MIPFFFFDVTGMIYMHWVLIGQTVNKEYYVEVLREFRKRFRRKRLALFKFSMLLRYILWDDIWPIFMISGSN